MTTPRLRASYVLPIRWTDSDVAARVELAGYLRSLARDVELFVVDGSPISVFEANSEEWGSVAKHLRPDSDLRWLNGKVNGVMTGLRAASFDRVVIADDDVRYDAGSLGRALQLLDTAEVVRPQNYFEPAPWHALWDTARTLLNRAIGADYPGTLLVRKDALGPEGYDGDVVFENLELLRTVAARGGRMTSPLDLYVARRPPTARHFWSQRVRQAYDNFAIPARMLLWLGLLPGGIASIRRDTAWPIGVAAGASVLVAEIGRRRAGGRAYFSPLSSLLAPLWLAERALTSWAAVGQRMTGGCRYAGNVIVKAASSPRSRRTGGLRAAATPCASRRRKV